MTREIATGTPELLCSVTDHVATVTLNRPQKRNPMSKAMMTAFGQMLELLESDSDVRALVLSGAGKAFCAGGDVSSMGDRLGNTSKMSLNEKIQTLQHSQENTSLRLYNFAKPTIAALPGAAAGAGMSLALACDLRIAAKSAFLSPAFGAIGLSGDYGGSWYLSKLIGPGRAKEIYFCNRRLQSDEALELGVFNRVVADDEVRSAAQAMAAKIAKGPPIALRYMKENHNHAAAGSLQSTMTLEADRMVRTMQTEDFANATAAFLAKKPPQFNGR